jgi:hypothetical protein
MHFVWVGWQYRSAALIEALSIESAALIEGNTALIDDSID